MNNYKYDSDYDSNAPRLEIRVEDLDLSAAADKIQIKLEQTFRGTHFRVGVIRTLQPSGVWKNKISVLYHGYQAVSDVLRVARSYGFALPGLWADTESYHYGMIAIGGKPTYTKVRAEITAENIAFGSAR